MKKLMETVATLLLAARYSFSFCWRNNKKETVAVIVVAVLNSVLGYLAIHASGSLINAVQDLLQASRVEAPVFADVMRADFLIACLFLAGVILFGVILGRLSWFYQKKWSQDLRFANERELNDHRATLDVARIRSKEYDDLSRRIQELPTGWQTRIWFSQEVLSLFMSSVSFVLFGISLLWFNPVYAAILLLTTIPMMIGEFRIAGMFWDMVHELVPQHKMRAMLERPYRNTNTFVQGIMFNQMPALRKQIDINVGGVLDSYKKIRIRAFRIEMATYTIMVLGLLGVTVHAAFSTVLSLGEIGTLTVLLASAKTFQGNLEAIISLIADQLNTAKGVVLIDKDFLGLKSLIKTENPITPVFKTVPEIRFEDVHFSYPNTTTEVLTGISFSVKPGSKVAIVGKSGSGKSTIQALLMRHYDPTSGTVYVDDIDLSRIKPEEWNKYASALTQEYTVLERRIGHEIASSRLHDDLNLDAVRASARFADFTEVVERDPQGLDSQIGIEFGGRDFSGGERQRLALARVHYRGTPILILDEPDAKLDPESAQKVIDQVLAMQGVTVIMITHHVSRAEPCDDVIVMGRGRIVEQGTHNDLMARDGVYASMWKKDRERLGLEA